jgi:uncharacterized delta-60 repeat protein
MKFRFPLLLVTGLLLSVSSLAQINEEWVARYTTAGNFINRAKAMSVDPAGNSVVVGTSWNGSNFDILTIKFDPSGNLLWNTPYNGTGNGYDEARAIATDAAGNVYITGYSAGLSANYDIVTAKYDINGTQQWATRFNGTGNGFDEGYDIAVDASGNVYVTGGTIGSSGGNNYITIKYNSLGVQQWATSYNNNSNQTEAAYALVLDASGNVYVTGTSYGGTANDGDIATVKYNNSGVQQWVSRFNGPGSVFDSGTDLILDATGNVYVCGYARDLTGTTNYSYATLKYNNAGAIQWNAIYDGAGNDYDVANAICLTPVGNVAVTGRAIGTGATAEDCVTILYDGTNGTTIWVRVFDGGNIQYDEGTAISADSSNRIFVTGYSYASGSNHNFLTIKYEANGDTSWIVKYNGPGNNSDQAYSISLGQTAELYVAGMSRGAGTNEDYAVVKYCQLTALGSNDTTICLGASTQLMAQSSYGTIDSVWWTPSAGLNQSNIVNPIANPTVTTPYVLHLRNQYGCIDLDTVTITVVPLPGPVITTNGPSSFCIGDSVTLTANDTSSAGSIYFWNTGDTTQSITVNTAGLYSVTITNTATCSSLSSINVNVYGLPNISTANDTAFCASSSILICAVGGVSYAWSPNFGVSDTTIACPTFGPTSSTTYIVYGTDANGCTSSDTFTLSLYPLPSVPVISISVGVFSSTPAVTYQWYFNNVAIPGATSQTYTPTQNGAYYVEITDANGCTAFSSSYNMTDVGISEIENANGLSIFPNPNNGEFTLLVEQQNQKAIIEIFSTTGQRVYVQQLNATEKSALQIRPELSAGVYLIRVTLEEGHVMLQKLIVE